MIQIDTLKGAFSNVQIFKNRSLLISMLSLTALFAGACGGGTDVDGPNGVDPNATAATVNGKAIKMEEVERAIKQQAQGQEASLSQLELASARLQVLQGLIEQEVMFQKAEAEGTMPTDEEVNGEYNKRKVESGMSAEQFDKAMADMGQTEVSAKDLIRRGLAIQKLTDKVTGQIANPNDGEIESFFNSNRDAFKNRRGAQLGAIVFDPRDLGEGDTTKSDIEAQQKAQEVGRRLMQGADFATVAREVSEDPDTRFRGGDWRYFTEEEMRQAFPEGFAEAVMTKLEAGQIFPQLIPFEGRYLIIKLQRKQETDEDRTLESTGVRKEIIDFLINSRKQLLAASYQTIAMNEARVENYLARKVVSNPNELSGARPAPPANANTAGNTNTSNIQLETNSAASTNTTGNANAAANSNAAPAANANTANANQ